MLTLIICLWLSLCLLDFSIAKLLFLPFLYCTLWEEVIVHSPPPWGQNVYIKLFGILHGRFVYILTCIYLLCNLYQYGLINIYYILLFIMQYYFTYFGAQIVSGLSIGSFQLALIPLWYTPLVYLCAFSFFTFWQTIGEWH